jgi:hypothetical protein
MSQDTHVSRALSLAVGLLLFVSPPAMAQTTIYPPSGPGGNYVIAVISDGYAADESWKFDRAVNGLVLNGLMTDPFYSGKGASFTIKKIFQPVGQSGQSAFGITMNYDINRCYIDFDPTTTTVAIENAVKAISPERTLVIGNQEGVSLGCTVDTWTYVSAGAREVGGVLEHEFGHLIAGLFDEYALPPNGAYVTPDVDGPNCSNVMVTGAQPSWMKLSLSKTPMNLPECRYYLTNIVRPYDTCRMRSADTDFCYVCSSEMSAELGIFAAKQLSQMPMHLPVVQAGLMFLQPPAAQLPLADRSVRVLVEMTKSAAGSATLATARVVALTEVSAPAVQRHRRVGDYVSSVVEGRTVLDVAVLPGDPFQRRTYGGASAPHQRRDDILTASIVVMIPHMTRQQLLTRSIGILFYRLDPLSGRLPDGSRANITPRTVSEFLDKNQPRLTEVTSDDLKKAVQSLPNK